MPGLSFLRPTVPGGGLAAVLLAPRAFLVFHGEGLLKSSWSCPLHSVKLLNSTRYKSKSLSILAGGFKRFKSHVVGFRACIGLNPPTTTQFSLRQNLTEHTLQAASLSAVVQLPGSM